MNLFYKKSKTAYLNEFIAERLEKTKSLRLSSSDSGAHKLAMRPHQFRETNETNTASLVIPSVSSERRDFIPVGFINSQTIVTNLAFVIYDAELFLMGVLTSSIHMVWVRTISGKLKSDYRYSSALSYNTFPFPNISEEKKKELINMNAP